jgi:hypothetical protein
MDKERLLELENCGMEVNNEIKRLFTFIYC